MGDTSGARRAIWVAGTVIYPLAVLFGLLAGGFKTGGDIWFWTFCLLAMVNWYLAARLKSGIGERHPQVLADHHVGSLVWTVNHWSLLSATKDDRVTADEDLAGLAALVRATAFAPMIGCLIGFALMVVLSATSAVRF